MIPVYVVTGLLGSGKTSLINVELRERKKLGSTEIISFETGNTEFIKKPLSIEPDDIEENLHHVIQQYRIIFLRQGRKKYGLNGMACFHFNS